MAKNQTKSRSKSKASEKPQGPKVLFFDVETAPILGYVWSIWEQNVALNQINQDWFILAWSAKWRGEDKVMYADQRHAKNLEDDADLLKGIHALLDEADIVVTQNGKSFDSKKLNARFIINGFYPPSPYKHIDTKEIASRKFGFTSNKLEYMTDKLNKKYKKLVHRGDYSGFELWKACLSGDIKAWRTMEKYNKYDVLSLEELYTKLIPWEPSINFDLYRSGTDWTCNCGSKKSQRRGFAYTPAGKFQQYQCQDCGAWSRGRENLLSTEKRKSLRHIAR